MNRGRRGVTLMELLIAVTLLSLLVAGVLTSMRVGLNAMQRSNARFLANRRVLGTQRLLEQQVAGLVPVVAECMGAGGAGPEGKIAFFQGEPQTMRFVSTQSLGDGARGVPQLLEFQVIPGEEGRGVRLVVNEMMYTGSAGVGRVCLGMVPDPQAGVSVPRFLPVAVGPGSFVLADKLAGVGFAYKELLPDPPYERWVPRWIRNGWPAAIRVEMAPLETDAARITQVSMTLPVHVNRSLFAVYRD